MTAYDTAVLADSPVAFWTLTEGAAPFQDSAGSYGVASSTGGSCTAIPGPSHLGDAARFPSGCYLNTSLAFTSITAASYECFFRSYGTGAMIATGRTTTPNTIGLAMGLNVGYATPGVGIPAVGLNANNVWIGRKASTPYNDGLWHHLAGVWSGGGGVSNAQFSIFVDGARVDTANDTVGTQSAPLSTGNLKICGDGHGSDGGFDLSRFAAYNYALSLAQITKHLSAIPRSGVWGWVG